MDVNLSKFWETVEEREAQSTGSQRVRHDLVTEQDNKVPTTRVVGRMKKISHLGGLA